MIKNTHRYSEFLKAITTAWISLLSSIALCQIPQQWNNDSVSIPALGPKPLTLDFSIPVVSENSIETSRTRYNELEQKTHELANKLKQNRSRPPFESERSELKAAVRKSFEARQAIQRAELADLAQRMKSMQQSIDMRDKLADKVIERRVEDLLNPNLKWDVTRTTTESTRSIAKEDLISPSKITSSKEMQAALQGTWNVRTFQSDNQGDMRVSQVVIRGDLLLVNTIVDGKVLGTSPWKLVWPNSDVPFEIEAIWDPNSMPATTEGMPGRIAYDGKSFQIAFGGKRPREICPGEEITYIDCVRSIVPTETAIRTAPSDNDLSTPQATLDTIHRYSVDHPMGVPVECFTEAALQELSGVMLQQLCFMSGLSQIGLQTGGVIGVKDNAPIVAGTAPSFHLSVDALLKEHSLAMPPEECTKAFELLAKLTLGVAFNSDESLVKPDRELFRLAAGILKSPKEFLPKAGELSERFNNIPGDAESPKKEPKAQPKYLIEIDGDDATATQIVDGEKSGIPMSFKLQRIDQRWLVSEAFSDEILNQMISSMSQVLGAMSAIGSAVASQTDSSDSKKAPDAASQREWRDFLKLLPESGTALVMFSYEPEIKEQMLPVAKKVAEAAMAELIELPLTQWRKILSPEATHFVLMKDRQLVGTRTGLMTEARLRDFITKAKDWLTPQSTGIEENSLVRIDCYINPGPDNIGSQHGGAYPLTTAVVAVHEDQALLFGPESIAEYIEKGYACVAIVRDASGNAKQVPMDVLLRGPVKLLGRSEKQPKSAASMNVTFGDGTSREVPLPGVASIYPNSVTELLEAYDVGSAIYHIRGVQGLKPVRLAAIKDAPIINQRVLSGSFRRERHVPPLHGFRSPIHWQSQTVQRADGGIYGGNINGAEMFEVLCPTRPAPCGFTFNEQGRLIGMYGLGEPSEKDMTHTVFMPDTTHSVLLAALEKIDAPGLRAALAQTLEESKAASSIKDKNRPAAVNAANANTLQSLTNPPANIDTPQALLARVDESSKAGSYEEFIALFSDEGVRDLAGSMLMQAVMQTSIDELSRQLTFGGVAEDEADFVAFRKVLQRWLPQSVTTAQQEAMGKGLSTIMSSTGGGSPDHAALNEFVISLRESVAGIGDHRKFSIEIMQAFERRTNRKFVFFGNADHENEWQISPFGDRAIATLIDGSPGMATTITLQQANGTWRISSLFNERIIETQPAAPSPTSTTKPTYSGHPISWWLDSYWDNAMASPKTAENTAQEYVASEAIRKLREKPECKAAIEAALGKWFASVEHEVNEGQLTRAAKCIVTIAGPSHQETAVNFLFKIWKRMPLLTHEQLVETADDASELNQLLSQLMLNDQLAVQFADRLTNGNSTDRSLVVYGLLSLMGRFGIETNKDLTELENWLRKHAERLAPAIEAASNDENEHIRFIALIQLATLIHATNLDPESLRLPTILLTAASDASPDVRYLAIDLLTSDEFAPAIKSQNSQIASMLISAMQSDSSINVRYSALNALMHMNVEAELVHKSLMEWAKSDEHEKVKYALDLTLRNHQSGDRPQSIDELIELLSDPEWGLTVEVNYNNWSTHHRWARQYAIAILGEYSSHAHRALPTLEAELARNNKDTLSFATKALERVRGYCPDLPIDKLQGQWEFVSIEKPEGSTPFFDLHASSDQQPSSVFTISGTHLKLGDRVLAELSHYRSGSRQGLQLLLDPDGKKLHCNGWHSFNPEFRTSSDSKPEWVKLEVRELLNDSNATERSKQVYEFRPLKAEAR